VPTLAEIRQKTFNILKQWPCLWQASVTECILKRDKDVILVSATGSGKTLTFWMPLLFRPEDIQIIISPLNLLGKQSIDQLAALGISTVAVTAENATYQNSKVCTVLLQSDFTKSYSHYRVGYRKSQTPHHCFQY
jgi:ATP-dependent DNA helicase RecQ